MRLIILRTWVLVVIKAVFFDWFNTLVRYEHAREELYLQAFRQFGFEPSSKAIIRGVLEADRYCIEENAQFPINKRSPDEQIEVYLSYPRAILTEAGLEAPKEVQEKIIRILREQAKRATVALFDDVLPTLAVLKAQKLTLGLLTNATKNTLSIHRQLGLEPYLDLVVTSEEVGADKPKPPLFLAALDRAGVKGSEAVHVGDQYELDVAGARGAGITPILLDRYDVYPEVGDCPRIRSLSELAGYLKLT